VARICVYCASSETIDPAFDRLADRVGAELAARGHDLVSGGGRVSMMGTLARAARTGGAHTLGVIPQALVGWEVADTEADELVVTPDMRSRKARMDDAADAFLALPGGLGTLEELLEVWVAGTLGMHAKPVVVLDPTGVYAPLRELVDGLRAQGFVRPTAADLVVWAADVGAAFDRIEAALAGRAGGPPGGGPTPGELLEAEA
jgi:uncharacterized protein (TIGR00730 family)